MLHEPSLPAWVWPICTAGPPVVGVSKRATWEKGSDVPLKFGCVTLVIASAFETPLSLAGLSAPVNRIALSATLAVFAMVSFEPSSSLTRTVIG